MRRLAPLAAATVLLTACSVADVTREERPAWVKADVHSIRAKFLGNPTPSSVKWYEQGMRRYVAVRFSDEHICGGCTQPHGVLPLRGRGGFLQRDGRAGDSTVTFGLLG